MDFAIEVLLSVCLIAAPDTCKNVQLKFFSDHEITPYECMMNGQVEISKWLEAHPKWRVDRWSCGRSVQRTEA